MSSGDFETLHVISLLLTKQNLKLYLSPVAKHYVVACLLTNCKT